MGGKVVAATATCVATVLISTAPVFAGAPTGRWSAAGTLSVQRPGPSLSVLLSDGRVLVAGASSGDNAQVGQVDIYDPSKGWSSGPQLLADPLGAVAAPLPNGDALLAGGTPWRGGFDGPGPPPIADAMIYEAAAGAWRAAPKMSTPRHGAIAAPLVDGGVLVAGGWDRKVIELPNPDQRPFCCLEVDLIPLASSEIFNPKTRTWSASGNLVQSRFGQSAAVLSDGRVLIVGGAHQETNPETFLSTAEIFDPASGRWTNAGDIGAPRKDFTLTPLGDGRALLAGGIGPDGVTVLRSTLLFEPRANSWSPGPDMRTARTEHAATRLGDGRVLVTGGVDRLGRLADSELFDPTTTTWAGAGALENARSDAALVGLKDGRVLVAGGLGSHGPLADSEIFNPSGSGEPPPPRIVAGPGSWVTKRALPAGTSARNTTLLKDGRVLVLPDAGSQNYVAQIYDPKSDSWITAFSRTSDQRFIAGVALKTQKVLLLTLDSEGQSAGSAEIIDPMTGASTIAASPSVLGRGSARLDLLPDGRVWLTDGLGWDKRSYFYDSASDRWSPGPDVPNDLSVSVVTEIPGDRVLVGGNLTAMILDAAKGTWSVVPGFPQHWNSYSATGLPNGDVLFAGGSEDQVEPNRVIPVAVTKVVRWNHLTGALVSARDMTAPRLYPSTVVLKDGRVLFVGGALGPAGWPGDAVATVEIYDPVRNEWSPAASMPEVRSQLSGVLLNDGTVLEMGGYGLFDTQRVFAYTPAASPPDATERAAAAVDQAQRIGLILGLVILAASGLVAWLLVRSAIRRRSARRL